MTPFSDDAGRTAAFPPRDCGVLAAWKFAAGAGSLELADKLCCVLASQSGTFCGLIASPRRIRWKSLPSAENRRALSARATAYRTGSRYACVSRSCFRQNQALLCPTSEHPRSSHGIFFSGFRLMA
ncbi:hypothetical protein KCP69_21735 [Salmonella enterica subsp. enterica]|nr:hypothetical protein KCP69_21735 [Salmonella enterica subsp. enterica]